MSPDQRNTLWSLISEWKEVPPGALSLEAAREIDDFISALLVQPDEVIAHADIEDKMLCGIHQCWRDEAVARYEARGTAKARST